MSFRQLGYINALWTAPLGDLKVLRMRSSVCGINTIPVLFYVESDPLGIEGGNNTYAYVGDNPLRFRDPQGMKFCGSGWNEWFVPDGFAGLVSFEGVCESHDNCYGTCGADQHVCDRSLRSGMRRECISAYRAGRIWGLSGCLERGDIYKRVLDFVGFIAFRDAQKDACKNCGQAKALK